VAADRYRNVISDFIKNHLSMNVAWRWRAGLWLRKTEKRTAILIDGRAPRQELMATRNPMGTWDCSSGFIRNG